MSANPDIDTIRAQAAAIAASGVLGRSRFYGSLLDYLVACAERDRTPKEMEIAAEVFGRGSEFDPSQDSMVRVYAHNLRQKLQQYYAGAGSGEPRQLAIPKGEYRLALVDAGTERDAAAREAASAAARTAPVARPVWLSLAALLLLGIGLAAGMLVQDRLEPAAPLTRSPYATIASSALWQPLLDDELPVLVVVGDYFIFGELDAQGNVERLIREFSINSSSDLNDLMMYQPDLASRYLDLDLTYLPRSSAFALRDLLRVLYTSDKRVRVISMSELNIADFKTSHIVYIGYISALDKLLDFVFASSDLTVGPTFDELVERATGRTYTSEAGMPSQRRNYRDYGLLSTFPGPSGNQFLVVAGTRDAGLMHTAQVLSENMHLQAAEQAASSAEGLGRQPAVELLFEVSGYDRTNLDAMIVHAAALDYRTIWGGELPPAP